MTTTEQRPPESGPDWRRLAGPLSGLLGLVAFLVGVGIVTTIAFSSDDDGSGSGVVASEGMVEPDLTAPAFNVNVTVTDEGLEPDILFIPAGRRIRLLIKNRGMVEHHYRIVGLDPYNIRWLRTPVVSEDEVDSLTEEELAAYGIGDIEGITDAAEIEHVLHHLTPWFERNRDESPGSA